MGLFKRASTIYKNEGLSSVLRAATRFIDARTPSFAPFVYSQYIRMRYTNDTIEKHINGFDMRLRTDDDGIHRDLLISGVREPASTKVYQQLLIEFSEATSRKIVVFDIGANIGYYVLLEASILNDQDQIVAIEPEKTNIKDLRENIEINGYDNIDIRQQAIGSKKRTVGLRVGDKSNLHKVVPDPDSVKSTVSVEMTSIDNLLQQYNIVNGDPLVIRIDVEGYETEVFRGMSDLLQSDLPLLVFVEIHANKITYEEQEEILTALDKGGLDLKFVSYDGGKTGKHKSDYNKITRGFANTHVIALRI